MGQDIEVQILFKATKIANRRTWENGGRKNSRRASRGQVNLNLA